jgi:2-polyprenyl-6-methoxyphenol hydroxylase-like FAD-dependent oxidoreductase
VWYDRPVAKALIVGGGPSGVSTALSLRRAGHDAVVFERGRDVGAVQSGGGMHLWNNATYALTELGAADRVVDAGERVERFQWYTRNGKSLGGADVKPLTERVGTPPVGLTRKDLHRALLGALGEDAIRFGAQCTGFEQDTEGVTLKFVDGSEERGDILVGADGLQSAVRRQLHGEEGTRYSGIVVVQASRGSPYENVPQRTYGMIWGRAERMGFYPVKGGTFWYFLIAAPEGTFGADGKPKDAVLEKVGSWSGPAVGLVEATPAEEIVRADIVDRPPIERWGEGRVTLLGDAAHPMTPFQGQGASQGIEDAVVLGRCLKEASDLPAALRRYEELRRPRTSEINEISWKVGERTKMGNPVVCAIRDRVIPRLFPRKIWPEYQQIIGYQI